MKVKIGEQMDLDFSETVIKSANGKQGILLNPYREGGTWVFRMMNPDNSFTDYDLQHSDLCVTINDGDAFFYENGQVKALDHSPDTLGTV